MKTTEPQRQFTLTVPRLNGESVRLHSYRTRELNEETPKKSEKTSFCELLKKQARAVMADVTECPPPALPANLTRLDNLRDIINEAFACDLVAVYEKQLSGKQLVYAATLADFLACLELTRKSHRAPAFVNGRDEQLAQIWHGIELLAGMMSQVTGAPVPESLTNLLGEDER